MNELIAKRPGRRAFAKVGYYLVIGHPTLSRWQIARIGVRTVVVRVQVDAFVLKVAVMNRLLGEVA